VEFIGRAYDDFLVGPQLGVAASRSAVSLKTRLSRRLSLDLPIISANMDSVTGAPIAKGMALEGGIGFIHRGMLAVAQAEVVARVKRTHRYLVEQPLCPAARVSRGQGVHGQAQHHRDPHRADARKRDLDPVGFYTARGFRQYDRNGIDIHLCLPL
jgi:IMP dehydrogenase/GMP reductase